MLAVGRVRVPGATLVAAVLLALGSAARAPAEPVHAYLSLGDSLAAGVEPDGHGGHRGTSEGYADDLARAFRREIRDLDFVNLGRGGETAFSMVHGTARRPAQLGLAIAYLRAHRGRSTLVTLDIGANDVENCHAHLDFDPSCAAAGIRSVRRNVPHIVDRLRGAGDAHVRIVGVNYYNGYLGRYLDGPRGRAVARRSVAVEQQLNAELDRVFTRAGVPVADVESAFSTDELRRRVPFRHARVPVAVERVCRWTFVCTPLRDDHPNAAGYRVIARTILARARG